MNSSNVDIMPKPTLTIDTVGYVPIYEQDRSSKELFIFLLSFVFSNIVLSDNTIHLRLGVAIIFIFFTPTVDFKVLFPCSGLKEGIVDMTFDLKYTSQESGDKRNLKIIIKRHCSKNGMDNQLDIND